VAARDPTTRFSVDSELGGAKPAETVYELSDSIARGLCLRIQPSGAKVFWYTYKDSTWGNEVTALLRRALIQLNLEVATGKGGFPRNPEIIPGAYELDVERNHIESINCEQYKSL